MIFDRIAEQKIRDAIAEGKFDAPADGRAIDLDDYFKAPEELRLAYSVLKSAGCVPEEVEHLKAVDRLRTLLDAAADESTRAPLRRQLAEATLRRDLALERARRK
jgi:hypothetical protein